MEALSSFSFLSFNNIFFKYCEYNPIYNSRLSLPCAPRFIVDPQSPSPHSLSRAFNSSSDADSLSQTSCKILYTLSPSAVR